MNIEPHLLCTFIAISCGHPLGIVAMHTRTKHTQVVVCCCLSTRVIMNLPATKENYYFERSWHMIHRHTHIPTIETCLHCSIGLHYLLSCVWVFFGGLLRSIPLSNTILFSIHQFASPTTANSILVIEFGQKRRKYCPVISHWQIEYVLRLHPSKSSLLSVEPTSQDRNVACMLLRCTRKRASFGQDWWTWVM